MAAAEVPSQAETPSQRQQRVHILSAHIERVLRSVEWPDPEPVQVTADRRWIAERYVRLRKHLDFHAAARRARRAWLEKVLIDAFVERPVSSNAPRTELTVDETSDGEWYFPFGGIYELARGLVEQFPHLAPYGAQDIMSLCEQYGRVKPRE